MSLAAPHYCCCAVALALAAAVGGHDNMVRYGAEASRGWSRGPATRQERGVGLFPTAGDSIQ